MAMSPLFVEQADQVMDNIHRGHFELILDDLAAARSFHGGDGGDVIIYIPCMPRRVGAGVMERACSEDYGIAPCQISRFRIPCSGTGRHEGYVKVMCNECYREVITYITE